nr:hypothetical protein [Tanacetum cinerariifolium]
MLPQVGNQGNVGNQNGNVVNENVQENIRNVLVNGNRVGYSYKEFLACNPKEYDGMGGVVVLNRWVEKIKAGHAAYTARFYELARLVPYLVTPENRKIERNGSNKINLEKKGNRGEPSKDRNVRDDNKRTRTRNAFATTTNPVRRENKGMVPKCTTCNTRHLPGAPCRTCFNCNRPRHFSKDYRVVPRNVNSINARNLTVKACYECGSTDHVNSA